MKTALLAPYEKDEALLELARFLTANNWSLFCSSGTAKYLTENNIPCRDVTEIVGPPILRHRVVTLSREIHAGLLAETAEDSEELKRLGITPIDLVYSTLYPLEQTVVDSKSTPADVIEKTDMGGPALHRSAAKGRRLIITNAAQIDEVEKFIKAGEPKSDREKLVTKLAAAAERRVANYVTASADYWEKQVK